MAFITSYYRRGQSKNHPVVARSTQLLVINWRMSISRRINFAPYDSTGANPNAKTCQLRLDSAFSPQGILPSHTAKVRTIPLRAKPWL